MYGFEKQINGLTNFPAEPPRRRGTYTRGKNYVLGSINTVDALGSIGQRLPLSLLQNATVLSGTDNTLQGIYSIPINASGIGDCRGFRVRAVYTRSAASNIDASISIGAYPLSTTTAFASLLSHTITSTVDFIMEIEFYLMNLSSSATLGYGISKASVLNTSTGAITNISGGGVTNNLVGVNYITFGQSQTAATHIDLRSFEVWMM